MPSEGGIVRALLYPLGGCQRLLLQAPWRGLSASTCDAGFFLLGFLLGSRRGASHISVILVKFLTVPLNRQIKVLYHGIESISR